MRIIDRFNTVIFNPFISTWLNTQEQANIWLNYLYNHSGNKEESPLLENYVFKDDTNIKLDELLNIIETMFLDKWNRLHDALTIDYGVLDNYNRVEDTETLTSGNTEITENNTNSDVMTGGHNNTIINNNLNKKSAYDNDIMSDNTETIENGSDVFEYQNETKTTNTTNNSENVNSESSTTHSVIKGNIGVTTSQQMLESEIELRKFNIINEMYNDLDTLLTIGIYI